MGVRHFFLNQDDQISERKLKGRDYLFGLMVSEMSFHSGRKVMGETQVHIIVKWKQRERTQEDKAPKDTLPSDLLPPASPHLML